MTALRLILGDQLSHNISALNDYAEGDVVLMCEVMEEATYVSHHPKKIALIFSAMRQFATELNERGINVKYIKLDDFNNTGNFTGEVQRAINNFKPTRLITTEAAEYRVQAMMNSWQQQFSFPVEIRSDQRFLATQSEFAHWAGGKKQLRMEFFYREMRKKYHILVDENNQPEGGQWNYDKENRKAASAALIFPKRIMHEKSKATNEVLKLVDTKFSHHFGNLYPFNFAVSRKDALRELDHFIEYFLPHFGDHQDAMLMGEPFLYHSLLSCYLNIGLLLPLEICKKAEESFRSGHAPLNAVEGFIRQILGWREFIRGVYWHLMPDYADKNFLNTIRALPEFYWTANTKMRCIAQAVQHTREHAYSHHIQRLMVTGNFALLAGIDVKQVQEWYLAVYADAFEWVEMPNTLGMALFGDGGIVASKPYAASGKYINKMSNYCKNCFYDPDKMIGDRACPFNALYWNFIIRHEDKFRGNQRMPYVYSTWDKFSDEKKIAIRQQTERIFKNMDSGEL